MPSTIAVVHYCEGAGHATRMLAVARALEARGAAVRIAGGGAGARFVARNGYDAFEPTAVDYIGEYQNGTTADLLVGSVPDSVRRAADVAGWLREVDPDALVTDDMFAVMAAVRVGVPQYVIKHDTPGVYADRIERLGTRFHAALQLSASRELFSPTVWEPTPDDPAGATHVPPLALDGPGEGVPDDLDVVVVPSHYSDLDAVAERLTDRGASVAHVGADGWEPVPALLPYLRAANAVVCSGYSTVMEAAVAGTPCVVLPATDEQEGVARRLRGVPGFHVVGDGSAAVAAAESPAAAPRGYDNGAPVVAERVLVDVRSFARSTTVGVDRRTRRSVLRAAAATVGVSAVGSAAAANADGWDPYWIRGGRRADRSLVGADAEAWAERTRDRYGAHGFPRSLPLDAGSARFDGATTETTRLDAGYDRLPDRTVVRSAQVTFALDDDGPDYRHWLWLATDATDSRARTGVAGRHPRALEPRHLRLSFAPAAGTVERVAVAAPGDGPAGIANGASDPSAPDGRVGAFGPDETPPEHPAGERPAGACSVVRRDEGERAVSLLGLCETSVPPGEGDWTGSQWGFAYGFRPADP